MIDIEVMSNHPQFILVHIFSILYPQLTFIPFVYSSQDS